MSKLDPFHRIIGCVCSQFVLFVYEVYEIKYFTSGFLSDCCSTVSAVLYTQHFRNLFGT